MLGEYYCLTNGKEHGPYSRLAIEELLRSGSLDNALIRSGTSVWRTAEEMGLSKSGENPIEVNLSGCRKCGDRISDTTKSCQRCEPSIPLISCFECSSRIRADATTCPECGAPNESPERSEARLFTNVPTQLHGGDELSSLRFRQSKQTRNSPRSKMPLIAGLLAAGGVAYWFLAGNFAGNRTDQGTGVVASRGNQVATGPNSQDTAVAARKSYIPSFASKSDAERDACYQAAQAIVRVAEVQARYVGEQRAIEQAMDSITEMKGQWCLEYWAVASGR